MSVTYRQLHRLIGRVCGERISNFTEMTLSYGRMVVRTHKS